MDDRLVLDYNHMMAASIGARGIDPASLEEAAVRFRAVHDDVERRRAAGELAFLGLPYERDTVGEIRTFAEGVGQAFDTVVVLGIGGSALGATALQHALLRPFPAERMEAVPVSPRVNTVGVDDPECERPLAEAPPVPVQGTLF